MSSACTCATIECQTDLDEVHTVTQTTWLDTRAHISSDPLLKADGALSRSCPSSSQPASHNMGDRRTGTTFWSKLPSLPDPFQVPDTAHWRQDPWCTPRPYNVQNTSHLRHEFCHPCDRYTGRLYMSKLGTHHSSSGVQAPLLI